MSGAAAADAWDVAVVGAGPAGGAAALAAARAGARTVLLERARLPRYKRCGGGLIGPSRAALDGLGVDWRALARDTAGELVFTSRGRHRFARRTTPFLPLVLRSELDAALAARAQQEGAQLRQGVTVSGYDQDGDGVVLTTSAGPLRARAVVGADGSGSRAARHVGVVVDQVDLGLEAELLAPPGADWRGRVLLDWGPVPGSYGWVFPKGRTLTVGVIGDRERSEPLRAYYRDLLARLGLDPATALEDGGALTRVRAPHSPLSRGRVLVAGDAAGLLEPWTREGISFALRSGALAGAAAAAGDPGAYVRDLERELLPEQAAGRQALRAFSRAPGTVHGLMRGVPGMWPLFVRLVDGRTTLAEQLQRRRVRVLVGALTALRGR